jgi:hypothetical protein
MGLREREDDETSITRSIVGGVAAFVVASFVAMPVLANSGATERVSVASDESQGTNYTSGASISGDGRFVGFYSYSALVIPDPNGLTADVFVRDRALGLTEVASVASSGSAANDNSYGGGLSTDGRFVVFRSDASNLVANDTNGKTDVFLRDRQMGTTERVSVASDGSQGNDYSYGGFNGSVSADGRFVAFWSYATNLVAGDTNNHADVFVRDRLLGVTERVSLASDETQGNFPSPSNAVISADGRYIGFISQATNLVAGDTNDTHDFFLRDRLMGTTERVNVASDGSQANSAAQDSLSISADGRYVAFVTDASNLVPADTNSVSDVFIRDRLTSTTERVSVGGGGAQGNSVSLQPSLSQDGRHLVFRSLANNLVAADANGTSDVFVRDLQTGVNELASVASDGTQSNSSSAAEVSISDDGRFVAFASDASNLVSEDTNNSSDVFVHDLQAAPADTTPPTVTCDPMPTFVLNEPGASVSATVEDADSGAQSPVVSASVSTAAAGTYTVELTGSDIAGNSTTVDCPYSIGYNFTGFFSPIDNLPVVNKANAGQTIPVKWRITDYNGVGISDPASFVSLTSGSTTCFPGDPIDVIETYSGSSGLQYLGDGNWQFNWKTPKSYAGQCRTMRLNLADGDQDRIAHFQFK